jgi:hypothetical protein
MDGGANPLMDRKVVGVVLFGVVAAWVNEILRKNIFF